MKFGIVYSNTGPFTRPEGAVSLARAAEKTGFESLWTVEHVVVPTGYESPYPYSRNGRMPGGEVSDIPDPLVWLTWVAASTSTIKLATGILILPQRNPVILAKEVATLDVLSGGRVILGVGVGWLKEEFDALGISFSQRGARTDEYIGALRALWGEAEPTFNGRFVNFEKANCNPKPPRGADVPIVIGGHSPQAARRAGRLGDGFFPARIKPAELTVLLDEMRTAARDEGRDPDAIEVTCGGALDVDGAKEFADLGVDRLVVHPYMFDMGDLERSLGEFSDRVVAPLA